MSYAWNWKGRDRATGEVTRFYTTGPYPDMPSLRDHIEAHYQGLVFVDAEQADGPPKAILRPVDPRHFQHGILDLVRRELGGGTRRAARPFGVVGDVRGSRLSAAPSRLSAR